MVTNLAHSHNPLLAVADRLREQYGFSVIPVGRTSKTPALVAWRGYQERRATADEVRRWFAAPTGLNVGIVCGAVSGVVVVDLDDAEAQEWAWRCLPPTPMRTRTPRGGEHWYYQHPGVPVGNRVRVQPGTRPHPLALDLRGDHGFVVAPGSLHAATGRRYVAPDLWPSSLATVPVYDPLWLAAAPPPVRSRGPVVTAAPVLDRARRYLATMPRPEIRFGSDAAVFIAAGHMRRGFGLPAEVVVDLLADWAGVGREGWTRDWLVEKVANAERFGKQSWGSLL